MGEIQRRISGKSRLAVGASRSTTLPHSLCQKVERKLAKIGVREEQSTLTQQSQGPLQEARSCRDFTKQPATSRRQGANGAGAFERIVQDIIALDDRQRLGIEKQKENCELWI